MIKNYFKTAWRNLWKNKFYTSINIAGLAIGLAIGIIILLWVKDEFSYNSFHSKVNDIYRINSNIGSGGNKQAWGNSPGPLLPYSKAEIPEVQDAVRIADNYDYSLYGYKDKKFTESKSAYIDPSFFSIFDFKLVKGNVVKPFPDVNSVIVTSSTAKKYFGNEDPIGKIISADDKDNFVVNGIIKDFPENSSIKYDILFPMELAIKNYPSNEYWKTLEEDWGDFNFTTFLQVKKGSSIAAIEKKLTQLQHKHNKYDQASFYTLQPLSAIHLYAANGSSSAVQTARIFLAIAILLLLIACINYVNLSTARSMIRAKEVSIRKIIGAAKAQLFLQFIFETAILFTIAAALAIAIIYFLMPLYNDISGKQTTFDFFDKSIWKTFAITIAGTLIAGSIYPALLLSSFKPIEALKGKLSVGIGNTTFRKVLVVAQFTFSVILIVSTLVIGRQLKYIREKELGYDKDNMLFFYQRDMRRHYAAIKAELMKQPGISGISAADNNIIRIGNTTGDTDWDGKEENRQFLVHPLGIDKDFISLMKLRLIEGKDFTGTPSDSAHYILNETAIREAGIKNPIGKRFKLHATDGTITGVVKDFHFASLKQKIEPAIFYYNPSGGMMYIKTTGKDLPATIAAAEKFWKQYNGNFPFEYKFLDDSYNNLYKSDQQKGLLFNVFAAIAILISCLGLLGLATYTAQIKTKEIGIRKVLGATVSGITGLLAKDFIVLVLIAILIASPAAWYFMRTWLEDFAYRTSISWWIFIVSGSIAALIAIITISFQAIRAALANPVKSLRTE